MNTRRCVSCGRRRPLKKMTEVMDGGATRCTYWQGRCLNIRMSITRQRIHGRPVRRDWIRRAGA